MKDNASKKAELIMDVLTYAHEHHLNITNIEDVKMTLKALGRDYMDEELNNLMSLLKDSDTFVEAIAPRKTSQRSNLPN